MDNKDKKWIVHVEYISDDFQDGAFGKYETYYKYQDIESFVSSVYINEGFIILVDRDDKPFIVNSKYIDYAYEKGEEKNE